MKAIELDKENGTIWSLGCDYALYADLFNQKGDPPGERESLVRAVDIFKECGADGWVTRCEGKLASLS